MRVLFGIVLVAGCAKGGAAGGEDARPNDVDSATQRDAEEVFIDAALPHDGPPPDAFIPDAPPDAFIPDAPPDACVPVVTEFLVNPAFDLTPAGTGWQQTVIDPTYPLVTDQDGVPEQSAPRKAWLGGLPASAGQTNTDVLWQQVMIPANALAVAITGFYDVRTSESSSDPNVYDTAEIALTQPNGTPIAVIRALSNRTPQTTWTPINHPVTQNIAGQPVVLRMTSSNDDSFATSFYFDTLSLKVTHCP